MRPCALAAWTLSAAVVVSSCSGTDNGERGGEPERQLAAATVAGDVVRVRSLLASGADPNKMAPYDGHYQSPWKLALHQVRPNRPDTSDIVRAMLKGGANPAVAWGEAPSRRGGYTAQRHSPMSDAVSYSAPEVARALMTAGLHPKQAETDLLLAVENGQSEIVHVLVEAGVDVNSNRGASTPLVAAIDARNRALMEYLEEHGARERP